MSELATNEERQGAKQRVESAVMEEAHELFDRVVAVRGSLYAEIALRVDRHSGGPEIVIDTDALSQLAIAQLEELVAGSASGFAVELHEGRIRLASASWSPDRIPF
jgi:hypothetical protein